jgi:hypothetical protein
MSIAIAQDTGQAAETAENPPEPRKNPRKNQRTNRRKNPIRNRRKKKLRPLKPKNLQKPRIISSPQALPLRKKNQ